jgi:hypothetical protein
MEVFFFYIVNLGDIYNLRKYYKAVDMCISCCVLRMFIDLFYICRRLAGYGFIERINMNMNIKWCRKEARKYQCPVCDQVEDTLHTALRCVKISS